MAFLASAVPAPATARSRIAHRQPGKLFRRSWPSSRPPTRRGGPGPVFAAAARYAPVVFESPQVNFYVRDVEESARFYRDSFGFTETFRTPQHGPPTHAELRLGAFTLGLATIESLRGVHGIATAESGPPRAELVVWTDDVDLAYADLAARKVGTLSAPHDFAGSLRAAWVADPDGNPVQIVMRRRPLSGHRIERGTRSSSGRAAAVGPNSLTQHGGEA
jgi:catechol 2,3-dioxygenase-like lactoylglutathione lyase family enzyme